MTGFTGNAENELYQEVVLEHKHKSYLNDFLICKLNALMLQKNNLPVRN